MVWSESVPLRNVPTAGRRGRNAAMIAGGLATALLIVAVAAVVVSSRSQASPQSLESAMLEPYFAWQAEQRAHAQNNAENLSMDPSSSSSSLSDDDGLTTPTTAEQLAAVSTPHVQVSHASVRTEMAAEFKDRDLLSAIKHELKANTSPRAKLAEQETSDDARAVSLEHEIRSLEQKKAAAYARLHDAQVKADPLLRKAAKLYAKTHRLEQEYTATLDEAKNDIALGQADLNKQRKMKHDFFVEEQPVENAEANENRADRRYRSDALRFAAAMLDVEKAGKKNKKIRTAAEDRLNALRERLTLDGMKRTRAQKKLEQAQSNIHVQAGLVDYRRWRLRGEKLISRGKTMMKQAQSIRDEADEWKPSLDRAQKHATDAETVVHARRDAQNKIAKRIASLTSERTAALAGKLRASNALRALEDEEVALKNKGTQLMQQYHTLKLDVDKREKMRAKQMARQAQENQSELQALTSSNNNDE